MHVFEALCTAKMPLAPSAGKRGRKPSIDWEKVRLFVRWCATYCLLTTIVSNTATSPTTLTFMAAPALTVQ